MLLSYPQWQGSGRPENLSRGANAASNVLTRFGTVAQVPMAGEGEARHGINRWTAILQQFTSAQAILRDRQPRSILTAGGDCACDIAVIDYLLSRHPGLQVIWVDAHLDANTATTSPSGNFHGMPVAVLMGAGPPELLEQMAGPILPAQFSYVSAHVGDEGDWSFQQNHGLTWLDAGTAPPGPVHIHFDLDSLDPAEFPHLAYPDGKLSMTAGLALVRDLAATSRIVGLTITEFAPADARAAASGCEYLRQLCEAAGAG